MDDIEINYIGEEEGIEESEELNDDYESRTVRVNKDGKKIRGKDMFWTKKMSFNNPREYEASNICQQLNDEYTRKRVSDFEYGTAYNYVCKFSHPKESFSAHFQFYPHMKTLKPGSKSTVLFIIKTFTIKTPKIPNG